MKITGMMFPAVKEFLKMISIGCFKRMGGTTSESLKCSPWWCNIMISKATQGAEEDSHYFPQFIWHELWKITSWSSIKQKPIELIQDWSKQIENLAVIQAGETLITVREWTRCVFVYTRALLYPYCTLNNCALNPPTSLRVRLMCNQMLYLNIY